MQKNPTSQQVQVVIDNFKKVLPIANGHTHLLNMSESKVYIPSANLCDTPMCHGGWYAAAVFEKLDLQKEQIDYSEGAYKMAKDLGFNYKSPEDPENRDPFYEERAERLGLGARFDLESWAMMNPKIWGNGNGDDMFSNRFAFESPSRVTGANSLQDIVNHWTEVRDRLIELEAQTKEEVVNG